MQPRSLARRIGVVVGEHVREVVVETGFGKPGALARKRKAVALVVLPHRMPERIRRQAFPAPVLRRQLLVLAQAAQAEHALGQAEDAVPVELIFHDIGDVAVAQEVEPKHQHVMLRELAKLAQLGCVDAKRLGEGFDR